MADVKVIEKKTACVDFDGTLCGIDYPRIGPIKPGAKEAMQLLRRLGYYIIISSCRSCAWNWSEYYGDTAPTHASERPVYQEMIAWLDKNEIPYDEIDDGTRGKVSADIMIDDKGLRFNNNWDETMAAIINLEESGSIG